MQSFVWSSRPVQHYSRYITCPRKLWQSNFHDSRALTLSRDDFIRRSPQRWPFAIASCSGGVYTDLISFAQGKILLVVALLKAIGRYQECSLSRQSRALSRARSGLRGGTTFLLHPSRLTRLKLLVVEMSLTYNCTTRPDEFTISKRRSARSLRTSRGHPPWPFQRRKEAGPLLTSFCILLDKLITHNLLSASDLAP